MKLSPKKNGKGYVTSYTINLGTAEARQAGFINADGEPLEVQKIIDPENNQIIIKLADHE
ncbi:hypothetical protein LJB89_02770 [Tyzzerella sp. OttesenSCG-928-J15]|nr:hypothetical protein [Tyzzerella sp. OttesenSCG-928-J15]